MIQHKNRNFILIEASSATDCCCNYKTFSTTIQMFPNMQRKLHVIVIEKLVSLCRTEITSDDILFFFFKSNLLFYRDVDTQDDRKIKLITCLYSAVYNKLLCVDTKKKVPELVWTFLGPPIKVGTKKIKRARTCMSNFRPRCIRNKQPFLLSHLRAPITFK